MYVEGERTWRRCRVRFLLVCELLGMGSEMGFSREASAFSAGFD